MQCFHTDCGKIIPHLSELLVNARRAEDKTISAVTVEVNAVWRVLLTDDPGHEETLKV